MAWHGSKQDKEIQEVELELDTTIRHAMDRVDDLNRPRILMLDDDAEFLELMRYMFSQVGESIECYKRLYGLAKAIQRSNKKAVLLDMDELNIYEDLKNDESMEGCIIIFFSASMTHPPIPKGCHFVEKNGNNEIFVKNILEKIKINEF